jgi:O-antigen ligase
LPLLAVGVIITLNNFAHTYFIMLASLPLCISVYLGNLSTDLPTEPLMALLMLCYFFYLLKHFNAEHKSFLSHRFVQLIFLYFVWFIIVAIFSTVPLISFKYIVAKGWYITAFLLVTPLVITEVKHFKTAFWCMFTMLLPIVVYTVVNHAQIGFAFDNSNMMSAPFFRNHVDYACHLSIFFPFLFVAHSWYKRGDIKRIVIQFAIVLFVFAIVSSFTRTAWLAIILCLPIYFIIKWKLIKAAIITASAGLLLFVGYITAENRYMLFAPDYKKTIMHHNLSDHLESTETLNDVSSAERLYRWVAAWEMFKHKPITGFGQGGFVPNYKNYAVSLFTTYLSGNIEKSTVHNYLLLLLTEQGVPGFLFFIVIIITVLIQSQRIYFETKNVQEQQIVMALIIAFIVLLFDNMLSDLIEAVKVGPFFYWIIALLVIQDLKNKKIGYGSNT